MDFLIIDGAITSGPAGPAGLKSGRIISDEQYDIADLKAQGVSVVEYNPTTMSAPREAFLRSSSPSSMQALLFAESAVGGGSAGVATRLDLFVSDINGDDSADGLTPETALKTWLEADRRRPLHILATTVIHLAKHGGSGYLVPENLNAYYGARMWIRGDGAGQPGDDGTDELRAEDTSVGGTTEVLVVGSGGMTPDEFVGKEVRITSGAATGYRRLIISNTATGIVPAMDIEGLLAGDTFRIVEPGVVIDVAASVQPVVIQTSNVPAAPGGFAGSPRPGMQFAALLFAGFAAPIFNGGGYFWGCAFDNDSSTIPLFAGAVFAGVDTDDITGSFLATGPFLDLPDVPDTNAWRGYGMATKGTAFLRLGFQGSPFQGTLVASGMLTGSETQSSFKAGRLTGGSGVTPTLEHRGPGILNVGRSTQHSINPIVESLAGAPAVLVSDGELRSVRFTTIAVGAAADAIVAQRRGIVTMTQSQDIIDASSGRYAFNAKEGGRVHFRLGASIPQGVSPAGHAAVNSAVAVASVDPNTAFPALLDVLVDTDFSIVERTI